MKKSISGIRGVFGRDLELSHAIELANSFSHMIRSGRCVIARDTRPSGPMMQEVAISALLQNGIDVLALEVAPTPVAFREARRHGAGIVVTSSHNPLEWNGLKFIVDGRGINEEELADLLTVREPRQGAIGEQRYLESGYVADAAGMIGKVPHRPRVVVDLGGGAAANTAPRLLEGIGCKVQTINESVLTSTRGPDPTSDGLADLVGESSKADIGFAFDLDGDRLVVVKDGVRQAPDVTLGLGVAKSLEMGHRRFVFSIDTSVSIEKFVRERGGEVRRSKVGEANVIGELLRTKSHVGGEGSSGGFILPEFNYCRDGILTSGLIASMLHDDQFGDILEFMGGYHQLREKVPIESRLHDAVMRELTGRMQREFSETSTVDGIRGTVDEDSWVLVRRSNTEDVIRVSAESNGLEKARKILDGTRRLVSQCHAAVK